MKYIHIPTVILLSLISAANGDHEFSSLIFQTNSGGGAAGPVTMTVWLDRIIYQCVFTAIEDNAQEICDNMDATQVGTYCDDLLDGQLLIANDNSDGIKISKISLIVASASDATDLIEYGIAGWCVDPSIPTGGFMKTGGNDCPDMGAPDDQTNYCGLNLVNTCDDDMNDFHTICIDNESDNPSVQDSHCAPAFQKMYFDFDCPMSSANDVLWMDGTDTIIQDETCNPTNIPTKSPTNIPSKSPTSIPSKSPTKLPTQLPSKSPTNNTNNPTKSPTDDSNNSSDE